MPERQVPDEPNTPPSLVEESQESFDERLAEGGYGNLDWSEAEEDILRESGLI